MSGPADAPRAAAAGVTPRLSVLLPTARAWPEIGEALAAALAQDCAEPFEILVLDGHGAGLAGEPSPPVRWLREPGADVFALRALGLAEARGEIVAISEDHCVLPPDWCRRILAAHRASAAPALVGPVANHPGSARRAVDRANFLLTMGPYAAPLDELPPGRLPIPTNLSLKRAALPAGRPPAGWLEYDLLAALRDRGQIGLAGDVTLAHLQSWRAGEALAVHFASGRAYGGSTRGWPRRERLRWLLRWGLLPRRLFRLTRPALERGAGGRAPTLADRAWLVGLILANAAGQLTGALAGAGASRHRLV